MEPNTEKVYPPSSYLVAYKDIEFLSREDLRPVRLQLELLKPELIMEEHKIVSTVVVFGSARLMSREEAKKIWPKLKKRLPRTRTSPMYKKYWYERGVWSRIRATMKRLESLPGSFLQPVSSRVASAISLWLPVGGRGSWKLPTGGPTKRVPNR